MIKLEGLEFEVFFDSEFGEWVATVADCDLYRYMSGVAKTPDKALKELLKALPKK